MLKHRNWVSSEEMEDDTVEGNGAESIYGIYGSEKKKLGIRKEYNIAS